LNKTAKFKLYHYRLAESWGQNAETCNWVFLASNEAEVVREIDVQTKANRRCVQSIMFVDTCANSIGPKF